jgi:hypothetical protein
MKGWHEFRKPGAGVRGLVSREQLAVSSQKPWRENRFNETGPSYQEITENRKQKTENSYSPRSSLK